MVIVAGEVDLITPVEHSRTMSVALPAAELIVVPGAGHVVILEQPDIVDAALAGLVARAAAKFQRGTSGGGAAVLVSEHRSEERARSGASGR